MESCIHTGFPGEHVLGAVTGGHIVQTAHPSFLMSPEVWRGLVVTGMLLDTSCVQQDRDRFPQNLGRP